MARPNCVVFRCFENCLVLGIGCNLDLLNTWSESKVMTEVSFVALLKLLFWDYSRIHTHKFRTNQNIQLKRNRGPRLDAKVSTVTKFVPVGPTISEKSDIKNLAFLVILAENLKK